MFIDNKFYRLVQEDNILLNCQMYKDVLLDNYSSEHYSVFRL